MERLTTALDARRVTSNGMEEANGIQLFVLELIDGEALAERLRRGFIRVEECLRIGVEIAEALEAAHEKGVLHLDLKAGGHKDHARRHGRGSRLRVRGLAPSSSRTSRAGIPRVSTSTESSWGWERASVFSSDSGSPARYRSSFTTSSPSTSVSMPRPRHSSGSPSSRQASLPPPGRREWIRLRRCVTSRRHCQLVPPRVTSRAPRGARL